MMYSIILIIMGLITISPVYERESQNKRKLLCRTTPEMASIFQMPPTFLFLIAFFYRGFPQMHYHIFICFLFRKQIFSYRISVFLWCSDPKYEFYPGKKSFETYEMHQIAIEISFSSFFSASRAFPFQAISRCVCLLDLRDLLYSWLELCKTISINLDANFGSMVREDHNHYFLCLDATNMLVMPR